MRWKINKLVRRGRRVSLDNTGGVSHLLYCGRDPSVKASTLRSVARFGPDPRRDAVDAVNQRVKIAIST